MADEVNIAQWLNTQGFTVKLYDEATTDIATTIYPTGGFAPIETTAAGQQGHIDNTIMIRYKGTSPTEINTRMENIKTALLTAEISGIEGIKLLSDKLALGKDATGHFFFSQNYIVMRGNI